MHAATRFVSVMLSMLLAVTMLPVAGLQVAYADESVERPATSGGDVALESTNNSAAAPQAPVAEEREDGMLAADGLMYTVADGGLALVGFDGEAPEGALAVPAAVVVDGREAPVVAIDLAQGQVADKAVVLSLPQSIKDINIASLAPALPALLSVEIAGANASSLPVAAGAASVRAAYSTSGGMLFRPTTVTLQADDGSIESIECKELLWAPPALVSARIPVECRAVAEGAFADVCDLKTVVAFGTMERIADGAFSTEQMESSKVVVPQASAAVTDAERVSASMALMGDAGQKERRSAWHEAGWRTDDIVMGKPYGSLTETVAVTDGGAIERTELQLVSYPGAHENAMDLKKPNADGVVEQAESGLAFTVKSDMTASVTWQGDKTATPARLDIPSSVVIDGVTYPVTEIAPNAFEGAAFLQSVAIPEGVMTIGEDAFSDCPNLADISFPSTLRKNNYESRLCVGSAISSPIKDIVAYEDDASEDSPSENRTNYQLVQMDAQANSDNGGIASYSDLTGEYASYDYVATVRVPTSYIRQPPAIDNDTYTWTLLKDVGTHYLYGIKMHKDEQYITCSNLEPSSGNSYRMAVGTAMGMVSCGDIPFEPIAGLRITDAAMEYSVGSVITSYFLVGGSKYFDLLKRGTAFTIVLTIDKDTTYDLTPYAKTNDIQKWVDDNYLTKAATDLDNFYDKAKFNTISYEGLDEADYAGALPTFYVNDAAKLPKVPEPRREGHEFLGWTWAGQETPARDPGAAFSGGGAVTLTAKWGEAEPETPEAKHFFTSDAPLRHDDASATQTHVIKVRLASSPGTLASVSFEGDDRTGLLRDTSGVRLFVGASEDALSSGTELSWGGSTSSGWECELAKLGEGSYGVYVGVSIPTADIDEASIPVSYADGSYVASLVKMNYAFA